MRRAGHGLWLALSLISHGAGADVTLGNVAFEKWGTRYALAIQPDSVSACLSRNGQPLSSKGARGDLSFKQRQPPRVVRFDFVPDGNNCLRVAGIVPQLSAGDQFHAHINPAENAGISMTVVVPGESPVPAGERAISGPAKRPIGPPAPESSRWQVAATTMSTPIPGQDQAPARPSAGNAPAPASAIAKPAQASHPPVHAAEQNARDAQRRIALGLSLLLAALALIAGAFREYRRAFKLDIVPVRSNPYYEALCREIWANPFRILEVGVAATRTEVERAGQRLLALLQIDSESARCYATPAGPKPRSADDVRQALQALRSPGERVLHELWVEATAPAEQSLVTEKK